MKGFVDLKNHLWRWLKRMEMYAIILLVKDVFANENQEFFYKKDWDQLSSDC